MKNLKKLRTSRHLSQFKLAELFHISQQSVWKYENDLAQPDLELIIAFANFFNTSIDYLVGNYETLSETELNEDELAHLRLYRASAPEVRKLSEQMMQLYFDMQKGSEKE
mgnify:CR=1 FL=1